MMKKIIILIITLLVIFIFLFSQGPSSAKKKLFIYFLGEEAGCEEYEWVENPDGFVLRASGELKKPISLVTEQLTIQLDRELRPLKFHFKGNVNGVNQEIETAVTEGEARNKVIAAGQTREITSKVSPDTLFLPNGIFSPYVVLAEKIKKAGGEKVTLPAYVVPQVEIKLVAEPDKENPHLFHLNLMGVKIELLTDEQRFLKSLSIPAQNIEARSEKVEKTEKQEKEEGIGYEMVIRGIALGKGIYDLRQTDSEILVKGKTRFTQGQVSIDFEFEEKLSLDWSLKEAHLQGKVNGEQAELKAKVEGKTINVSSRQGAKTSEKKMPFTTDVIFSSANPLLDSLLMVKKSGAEQKKRLHVLSVAWGSYYLEEPLFFPVTVERCGEEALKAQDREIKTEKYFTNSFGSQGEYTWVRGDEVLKVSSPFTAVDVYHQDFKNLKTKEITSPEIISDKYSAEEVSFPSGRIKLAGTLTIPKNGRLKHPCAVLISGSGPQDRNEDTVGPGGLKFGIFKQIAHALSENGIAVLRYDDRGTARSEGNFIDAAEEDLAEDVKAAVAYLKSRDDIVGDRIVLIGHSEGAIIAPQVAADDPLIRGVVLLAGTAETGDKVLREQFDFILENIGLREEDKQRFRARYEELLKIIRGEPAEKEAEEKIKSQLEPQLKWLRSFVGYDPLPALERVNAAVLIVNGGKDKQVLPRHARMLHEKLIKLKKPVTLKIYPDLNHLLIPSETGDYAEYARQAMDDKRVSKNFLDFLTGWVHGVLFSKLMHDTGETMRHDQYGLQINRAWVEERLKTPFQWGKKSK